MAMSLCRGVLGVHDVWLMESALVPNLPDFARAEPVYDGTYTRIWRHPDRESLVSKLAWVKTMPRDNLRKYWAAQARREIVANRTLQRLGLVTTELQGFGIRMAPWARVESILFMRELPGHDTLRVVLRGMTDPGQRAALLDQVAADIAAIYRNGYHHKDCHLENVLRPRGGKALIWVDNDLRYCPRARRARKRLGASLQQLVETSRDFISTPEWRAFARALAMHLSRTDLGRELAARTVADFRASFVA